MPPTSELKSKASSSHADLGHAPHLVTDLPGPRARAWIERDQAVTSPSNTRDFPLVARRALGCVVEDVDGNRFLDFAAGIAVCATGHCHPTVVDAIKRQADNLIHICGSDFYYEPMVLLSEKLAAIAPGSDPKRVLLTNSGAEVIEAAIKLSRFHTDRKGLIAFHGAFHGRTMGALSLTSSKVRQKQGFGPLIPMVAHAEYGNIASVENIFKRQTAPDEVAAIFVEPMQGEGGYIVPPAPFLVDLRALCDKHGILLVADEIQSGMGRTGKWFACEHFGVVPDLVCVAKGVASGMPIGALVAPARIMNWPPGAQGSTFGGNPVSCAAALATIELIESQYMRNAAQLGETLQRKLNEIATRHPSIGQTRGLGLMVGATALDKSGRPSTALRNTIVQEAFKRGLILLGCGEHGIRFAPPLCVNADELDRGLALFEQAVAAAT
ncbi:MAG: acetyl ornithine aminotransferase family protein [Phycisphaerales bacterium]|nr:acetyl ornithine aminotransferase family protein [Phycisphaerales bacterium]